MPVVSREVVFPVPRERAWELVTEPAELETWLADAVEFEPEEGAPLPRFSVTEHRPADDGAVWGPQLRALSMAGGLCPA